jgi:hypothetical protein
MNWHVTQVFQKKSLHMAGWVAALAFASKLVLQTYVGRFH